MLFLNTFATRVCERKLTSVRFRTYVRKDDLPPTKEGAGMVEASRQAGAVTTRAASRSWRRSPPSCCGRCGERRSAPRRSPTTTGGAEGADTADGRERTGEVRDGRKE